jgi:hypothetical protein
VRRLHRLAPGLKVLVRHAALQEMGLPHPIERRRRRQRMALWRPVPVEREIRLVNRFAAKYVRKLKALESLLIVDAMILTRDC